MENPEHSGKPLNPSNEDILLLVKNGTVKACLFQRPADELHVSFVAKEIKSLPQRAKDYYYQDCIDENGNPIDLQKDDVVKFTAYICMKAADGTIVNGWLASQSDMLANDWMIFEF